MSKRILIIDGHPDPAPQRYVHALAAAYEKEAVGAGHEVRTVVVANLQFPALRTKTEFESVGPCGVIEKIQDDLAWCEHLVLVYPLWFGSMPAIVRGVFEQILRPLFVLAFPEHGGKAKKRLRGKSVRIIVTMGMPAIAYRWYYGAHSLKCLKRNVLSFCGMGPIRSSVVGLVGVASKSHHLRWMDRIGRYAARAL
jgi:putative NADPH-quinone reductase